MFAPPCHLTPRDFIFACMSQACKHAAMTAVVLVRRVAADNRLALRRWRAGSAACGAPRLSDVGGDAGAGGARLGGRADHAAPAWSVHPRTGAQHLGLTMLPLCIFCLYGTSR